MCSTGLLEFAGVFLFQKHFRPMAGGVFIGKAVEIPVFFKVHFLLKAGFVGGILDIPFAADDISFFGSEKGADVMNGFAVVIILARQRNSFPPFKRCFIQNHMVSLNKRRSSKKTDIYFRQVHIFIMCSEMEPVHRTSIAWNESKVNRKTHKT